MGLSARSINLARDAVPQGGAKCTIWHAPLLMRSMANCRCVGCNKSNLTIGPFKRVDTLQSMPTLSTNYTKGSSRL